MRNRRGSGRPPAGDTSVRDALLRAAATQFSHCGYAGASTRAILAGAGATAPALYHHFGNKTGLYIAAASAAQDHVLGALEAVAETATTGADRVAALFAVAVDLRREHPNVAKYLSVIQQDVARHPELAELKAYEPRFDRVWRGIAGEKRPLAVATGLRAVFEGLLSVGGADLPHESVVAAANFLADAFRDGGAGR